MPEAARTGGRMFIHTRLELISIDINETIANER